MAGPALPTDGAAGVLELVLAVNGKEVAVDLTAEFEGEEEEWWGGCVSVHGFRGRKVLVFESV